MIFVSNGSILEIGGKAYNLINLNIKNTPKLVVCPASFFDNPNYELLDIEINNIFSKKVKYAVRSSAIDEDSKEFSFAGIHMSFLNVEKKDIKDSIIKVYESAFSENAINYRKNNGISTSNIRIAVIVQEMVDAEYSGVINTINPITNNPDETIISVTRGLGESLVDGSVSGSTYKINNGNISVENDDILSKKIINNILKMVDEVSKKCDYFLDIEFSVKKNKVYFLQARAITVYKDINPHKRSLVIDNANIRESYYGFTSYLTYTFAKDVYRDVYTYTLNAGCVRKKIMNSLRDSLNNMLYYHEGKVYYNLNSWYHVTSIFSFKKSSNYMENMMGVNSSSSLQKRVKMNIFDIIKLGFLFVKKVKNIDKLSNEFIEKFNRVVLPYYGKNIDLSNEELVELYNQIENDIVADFSTPIINDCAVMIFYGLLKDKAIKLGLDFVDINRALSNHGDVLSVGSANELNLIAKYIKNNNDLYDDFVKLSKEELYEKYHNKGLEISNLINDYIINYGSRVMDELKLETITMIEDNKMIYDVLKELVLSSNIAKNEVDFDNPKKLKWLINNCKKFIKNRERLRLKRTYIYSVVRNIFLCFGKNYYNMGLLDDPRDVFYLSKDEVLNCKGVFKELVSLRKKYEKENKDKNIYDRVVFYDDKYLPVLSGVKSGKLVGIPSGAGVVKARVSYMSSTKDRFVNSNIILTKRTDPGWIMLFPMASGLIVEHGSMLSHSFVVAREMGLPAVVNVPNVCEIIKDNDLVTLDGLKGEIILED